LEFCQSQRKTSEVLPFFITTEVIFVKDLLFAGLALVSAVIAAFCFVSFRGATANKTMLIVVAILFTLLALGFGAMFLAGRVNKNEDIHITE
jgi:predicted tellurium resistance membrane protein TerC